MATSEIVDLLEVEWDNIQGKLSKQEWDQFSATFSRIVEESSDDPESLQRTSQAICASMDDFEYTRYLLEYFNARQSSLRGIGPPSTISDRVEVRAICNRLRNLSTCNSSMTGHSDCSSIEPAGDAKNVHDRNS